MINISNELKTIYKNDRYPLVTNLAGKELEAYFPDLNLTVDTGLFAEDKGEFELTESICSDDDLIYGKCNASKVKFTLANVDDDIKGKEFVLTQKVNDTYSMPLGVFKVDTVTKQDDLIFKDVVAYDRMKKIEVDVSEWYNSLTFPITLAVFRASFLTYVGLDEDTSKLPLPNDSMIVEKTIEPTQLSGRTVIEACEEINGCFGHINRDGKFTHIILKPAYGLYPGTFYPGQEYPRSETDTSYLTPSLIDETITQSMTESVRFEEYTTKAIFRLQIRQQEDDIGAIVADTKGVIVDTQTGTSVSSSKSEDATADITKIEGNSSQTVTVQGKNLIDSNKIVLGLLNTTSGAETSSASYCRSPFIPVYPNEQYTYSVGSGYIITNRFYFNANKVFISQGIQYSPTTITTPENCAYVRAVVRRTDSAALTEADITAIKGSIQLEKGSGFTAYVPFVPNSPSPDYPAPIVSASNFNITASNGVDSNTAAINHTLCSLPNGIRDTIEVIGEKLYKVKRINNIVFDGVTNKFLVGNTTWDTSFPTHTHVNVTLTDWKTGQLNFMSSRFKCTTEYDRNYADNQLMCHTSNAALYLFIENSIVGISAGDSIATRLSKINTWIQSHNFELHYELATPTYTEIPDITLDTYKGTTTISTSATPPVNITANYFSNTDNTYVIQGNFLVYGKGADELETIATNIFGYIAKRPYRPYQSSNIGLPYIEVGDMVEFSQNDPVRGYVLQRTLTGIQALRDEFGADGEEEQTQSFGLNYEVMQTKGRLARLVKTVEQVSVTVQDLETDLTGEIAVLAGQVVLKVDTAGNIGYVQLDADPDTDLTSIKLKADNISLEGLITANNNFKILADGSMEAVNGKFSGVLVAATGEFTGTLTGNTINSPTINGGTINATTFNQVGTTHTTTISNGAITTSLLYQYSGGSTSQLTAGNVVLQNTAGNYNVTLANSGLVMSVGGAIKGVFSADGYITCVLLNNGTPITSLNVGSYASPTYHTHTSLYDGVAKVTAFGSNFRPHSDTGDNSISCGSPSYRWTQVFAATPVISTSDSTMKQQGRSLSDAERRVAIKIKNSIKAFKFNDAVSLKGDGARWHTGIYAQELISFFEEEGLDVYEYSLFCSDTWYEKDGNAVKDDEAPYTENDEGVTKVTRLGVRYEELWGFVIASL
jgi:hypothetical protein